jgi:hypothetical protein
MTLVRLFFFVAFLSFLAGCSLPGTQTESVVSDSTVLHSGSGYEMLLPKSWSLASGATLPTPYYGTLALAYVSSEVKSGYANTLLIMQDRLSAPMSSRKYSELNSLQTYKNYLERTNIEESAILFDDDEESVLSLFEARYNRDTPRLKFMQTARVCGSQVFLIHFSLALDKDPKKYLELIRSFTCK